MLKNLKKFFNVQFKIEECQDDVYDETSSDEDKGPDVEDQDMEEGEEE